MVGQGKTVLPICIVKPVIGDSATLGHSRNPFASTSPTVATSVHDNRNSVLETSDESTLLLVQTCKALRCDVIKRTSRIEDADDRRNDIANPSNNVALTYSIEDVRNYLLALTSSNRLSALASIPEPNGKLFQARSRFPQLQSARVRTACCSSSDSVELRQRVSWYYGAMTQEEASARLHNTSVGTFLLRDSSQRNIYPYSLSVMTSHGVTSVRIACDNGFYSLDTPHLQSSAQRQHNIKQEQLASKCIVALIERLMTSSEPTKSKNSNVISSKRKCVLLDANGKTSVELVLKKPLVGRVMTLTVLCCKALNQSAGAVYLPVGTPLYPHAI
jgi:hypothetical protein